MVLFFISNFLKVVVNFEKYDKQFVLDFCVNIVRYDNKQVVYKICVVFYKYCCYVIYYRF